MSNKIETSSTGAIRKTIVRNVEVPVDPKASKSKVIRWSLVPGERKHRHSEIRNKENESRMSTKNLQIPQPNTVRSITAEIDRIQIDIPSKTAKNHTESLYAQKITKRLNIPLDKAVYKNLVPINVNNSFLQTEDRKPIRSKYVSKANKDPVPELADFLKPIEPLSYVLPFYSKPLMNIKPSNEAFRDVYEVFNTSHPND